MGKKEEEEKNNIEYWVDAPERKTDNPDSEAHTGFVTSKHNSPLYFRLSERAWPGRIKGTSKSLC